MGLFRPVVGQLYFTTNEIIIEVGMSFKLLERDVLYSKAKKGSGETNLNLKKTK